MITDFACNSEWPLPFPRRREIQVLEAGFRLASFVSFAGMRKEFSRLVREGHSLRLPCCDYQNLITYQPRSLKQATRALADLGTDAMLVAGGTDVYPKMKRGQFTPRHLISLRPLRELKGIRQSKEGLWIGAGESLTRFQIIV